MWQRIVYPALLFPLLSAFSLLNAQPAAFLRPLVFCDPESGPYVETSMTVIGTSLTRNKTDGRYRNSVTVNVRILKDSTVVAENRYNLHGPFYTDTTTVPAFIDFQRYPLPNGVYTVEVELSDPAIPSTVVRMENTIVIDYAPGKLYSSHVQPVEHFSRTATPGPLTRSGFDLMPFNSDFYAETSHELSFYYEVYNAATVTGNRRPISFEYYLENAADSTRLPDFGGAQRAFAMKINPLAEKIDIRKLPTGDYSLVIRTLDARGNLLKTDRHYFSRRNGPPDLSGYNALSAEERITAFVGKTNSNDTLQMFVECLWPIANSTDKDRIVQIATRKNPDEMKKYVVDFWQRRAADTANPLQMWAKYYQEVQLVLANFRCGKQKGYYSERGRVMLQYGMPSQRTQQNNESNAYPYEIWIYYRIVDRVNGHFFSNRRFVFVNKNLGDECHTLVHSDMRGEINNPRWQYEVARRNFDGIGDPDRVSPRGTEYNQFKEIYKDPR